MIARPSKVVLFKKVRVTVYSIAWLAHLCNRSADTIRRWERRGVLPKPILSSEDGRRWYTASELRGYANIVKANNPRRHVDIESTAFKAQTESYKHFLQMELARDPSVLGRTLLDSQSVKDSMTKQREAAWQKRADSLIAKAQVSSCK